MERPSDRPGSQGQLPALSVWFVEEKDMKPAVPEDEKRRDLRSWIIVVSLAVLFLAWGLFIFFTVGDKGPPSWDFSVVEDIPGQSPYSTETHTDR
jgi:hypothetical protein